MLTLTDKQVDNLLEWRDALKSGGFNQVQATLKLEDSDGESHYCCLGVALEIHEVPNRKMESDIYNFFGHGCSFPNYDWFSDTFGIPREIFSILNDQGVSFKIISDVITALVANRNNR